MPWPNERVKQREVSSLIGEEVHLVANETLRFNSNNPCKYLWQCTHTNLREDREIFYDKNEQKIVISKRTCFKFAYATEFRRERKIVSFPKC